MNFEKLVIEKELATKKNPKRRIVFRGKYSTNLPQKYERWVDDIVWDLAREGIIRPGYSMNNAWSGYHLTEYGERLFSEEPVQPNNIEQYLKRIQLIPDIDEAIIKCIEESLRAS